MKRMHQQVELEKFLERLEIENRLAKLDRKNGQPDHLDAHLTMPVIEQTK
ncbi:hypothetical protein [Effusibacillus pohliae]|nr:hypothetical protein [Effusibacillus pohliae]